MIKRLIVYNLDTLKKHQTQSYAKRLFKGGVITEKQQTKINENYASPLFTPSYAIRVLLFLAGIIGTSTLIGPIVLLFADGGFNAIRFMILITGIIIIVLNEKQVIKNNNHYKSGLTESLCYIGFGFTYFGLLGESFNSQYLYLGIGLLFSSIITIRYLDLLAFIMSIILSGSILFNIFYDLSGIFRAVIPFVFIIYSGVLFLLFKKMEAKNKLLIFENHFTLAKTISLLCFYLAGNYFVVRELSVELMNLRLVEGENIPYYYVFYAWTALIPLLFLFLGVKNKSILFIRMALLCIALSIVTLKMYFSLGMPIVTITLSGAVSIIIALSLMRYLKQSRFGYTRNRLIQKDWHSEEITAFAISQTAGGQPTPQTEDQLFSGGKFGGGGAGSEF